MTQDRTVSAGISLANGSLTVVDGNGDGIGTVDGSPGSIACTLSPGSTAGTCSEGYPNGTVITLQATPFTSVPSTFDGWLGAGCSGTATCSVTIAGAMTVQARFLRLFTLEIQADPQALGGGTVTSVPSGIGCSIAQGFTSPAPACDASFASGTQVTLTATPDAISDFAGWGGACAQVVGVQCTVSMTAARSVTVAFAPDVAPVAALPGPPAPSPR
jgi:hypothetical protein